MSLLVLVLCLPAMVFGAQPSIKAASFTGIAAELTDTGAACPDITCNIGDTCDCLTGSVTGKGGGFGGGTLSVEISVDTSVVYNNGEGQCHLATTVDTFTQSGGKSTANVKASGWICQDVFSAGFRIASGTGKFAGAIGTGSIQIRSHNNNTNIVISGDLVSCPNGKTLTGGTCQ